MGNGIVVGACVPSAGRGVSTGDKDYKPHTLVGLTVTDSKDWYKTP